MRIRIIQIILIILSYQMSAYSQDKVDLEEKVPLSSKIYFSYIIGAQLYNDNALYNPGVSALFTQSYRLSGNVDLGIGSGYTSLLNERFVPFYFELFGYKKKNKNSPIIRFQIGYSAAWYATDYGQTDYDLDGGFYFTAGMGRRMRINNRYAVLFHWSYCHQSGKINYQIFGNQPYTDAVNYDMIQLGIGLIRVND